jgi:DMSO/TMAO reductase YedYZ molybdopterin-dependent catalytic subunit
LNGHDAFDEMMKPIKLRDGSNLNPVNLNDFFVLSPYNGAKIEIRDWALDVGGMVQRTLKTSYADLIESYPKCHAFATLECVRNEAGGDLVGTALWSGVALRDILEEVGVEPESTEVIFEGADGLFTLVRANSIPLDEGLKPYTLLAYEMNGKPLPIDNGFPLRLVAPGFYGDKWRKWLTGIKVINDEFMPPQELENQPKAERLVLTTKLFRPLRGEVVSRGPCSIVGASWGSKTGIGHVDVSVDGGDTWDQAEVVWETPSPHAWTVWEYLWEPSKGGDYEVMGRAIDREGRTQIAVGREPYPSGLAGLDRMEIVVR